jgi:hypothetical protein
VTIAGEVLGNVPWAALTRAITPVEHEHVFYAHRDPRWLVCDCGQLAQRTVTAHGQHDVRLIDEPTRAVRRA